MKSTTSAQDAALQASNVPMAVFVDLDFASGHLYVCNAAYSITWGGHTWLGAAGIGAIEEISETSSTQPTGIRMTLSGVDPAKISIALAEAYQGRACTVYYALLDSSYQVIDTPVTVFRGRMDVMDVDIGETATITLTATSRLADWNYAAIRRFNHEDQIADYPTDKFFEYVTQMVDKQILWGVPSPVVAPVARPYVGTDLSGSGDRDNGGG